METNPALRDLVLDWAAGSLRDLPWRRTRDPWAILVAETMLQQTQVARVEPRWEAFLRRWPDPTAAAADPPAALVREWAGLGYNRRALNLHRSAVAVVEDHGGVVPSGLDELLSLPGVGPYTARAVRAFAFELPAAPVDTNIGRVLARLSGTTLSRAGAQHLADALVPATRVWDWNQALMELGALVCRARDPHCAGCPVETACRWRGDGPDPATGSAAVSRAQEPFAGSDRELRGRLVARLRGGPIGRGGVCGAIDCADEARVERIVGRLVRDGLVEIDGPRLRLAGDRPALSPDR